jgi:hypothetical protein
VVYRPAQLLDVHFRGPPTPHPSFSSLPSSLLLPPCFPLLFPMTSFLLDNLPYPPIGRRAHLSLCRLPPCLPRYARAALASIPLSIAFNSFVVAVEESIVPFTANTLACQSKRRSRVAHSRLANASTYTPTTRVSHYGGNTYNGRPSHASGTIQLNSPRSMPQIAPENLSAPLSKPTSFL